MEARLLHVRRSSFAGVKADPFDAMAAFTRDVPGRTPGHRDVGWAVFGRWSGERDLFDLDRPRQDDERLLLGDTGVTIASAVDELLVARAELLAAGVELVADAVRAAETFGDPRLEGWGWLFLRSPDGRIDALPEPTASPGATDRGAA